MSQPTEDSRSRRLQPSRFLRGALLFGAVGVVLATIAAEEAVQGGSPLVITGVLLAVALLAYFTSFNVQLRRAYSAAENCSLSGEREIVFGVESPGRIWFGNGWLLAVDTRKLVGVKVGWLLPAVAFTLALDQGVHASISSKGKTSVLDLSSPSHHVSINAPTGPAQAFSDFLRVAGGHVSL